MTFPGTATFHGTRAVFLDAGFTLVYADPAVEVVYQTHFARAGLVRSLDEVGLALHATWRGVAAQRNAGDESWDKAGGERGFWRRFVGVIWKNLGGGPFPEPMLRGLVDHFQHRESWKVYPDVRPTLLELRRLDYRLFVLSNWDTSLEALLTHLELTPLFDGLVVSARVGCAKPHKGIFEEALRKADVPAGAALHVGDSPVEDYDGARSMGIPALLLDRAGRAEEGVHAIRSLEELLPLLHRTPPA